MFHSPARLLPPPPSPTPKVKMALSMLRGSKAIKATTSRRSAVAVEARR